MIKNCSDVTLTFDLEGNNFSATCTPCAALKTQFNHQIITDRILSDYYFWANYGCSLTLFSVTGRVNTSQTSPDSLCSMCLAFKVLSIN